MAALVEASVEASVEPSVEPLVESVAAVRLPPRALGPAALEFSAPEAEVSGAELPSPASALATAQPTADPAPATTPATAIPRQISLTFFTLNFSDRWGRRLRTPSP